MHALVQVGTTSSTAVDPLLELGKITKVTNSFKSSKRKLDSPEIIECISIWTSYYISMKFSCTPGPNDKLKFRMVWTF